MGNGPVLSQKCSHGLKMQPEIRLVHRKYLYFLQKIGLGATLLEHLLHLLPFGRHPHPPSPHSRLDSDESLHASQSNRCLLSHLPTSHECLEPHHSLKRPQRPSRLKQSECTSQKESDFGDKRAAFFELPRTPETRSVS